MVDSSKPEIRSDRDGNVVYEGFAEPELLQAKSAVRECRVGAIAAADTVRHSEHLVDCGETDAGRLRRWFGLRAEMATHADLYTLLRSYLMAVEVALQSRPLRLIHRPDIIGRHLPIERPVPEPPASWARADGDVAFRGFGIVCPAPFLRDRTPHAAAALLYHELSHRICGTKDVAAGDAACRALTSSPARAIGNADNHALMVLALLDERLADPL